MQKKGHINGSFQKVLVFVLGGFVLYSTGVVNVLADFWRTFDRGQYVGYDIPASEFTYGYGYGDLGWGYGYGYGYGYGSYEAGYMVEEKQQQEEQPSQEEYTEIGGAGGGVYVGGGGGGGGGGSYGGYIGGYTPSASSPVVNIYNYKEKIAAIQFKTPKFKKVIPLLNKLIEEKVISVAILLDKNIANDIVVAYYKLLKVLSQYESGKVSKDEVKKVLKEFLAVYNKFKQLFNKVVSKQKVVIKGVSVELWKVKYKSDRLNQLVDKLDNIIVKYLEKSNLTANQIKEFVNYYNKFKLAVKYMKEKDKVEGKKIAVQYLKKMIEILKNK